MAALPLHLPESQGGGTHLTLQAAQDGDGAKALEMFGDFARRLRRNLSDEEKTVLKMALIRISKGVSPEMAFMHRHKAKRGLQVGRKDYENYERDLGWYEKICELCFDEKGQEVLPVNVACKEFARTTFNPNTRKPYSSRTVRRAYDDMDEAHHTDI